MSNQQEQPGVKLDVRVYPIAEPKNSTVAYASANIAGVFAVNGVKVVDGEKGLFVAMPSAKDAKGEYRDVCFPITKDFREQLHSAVLDAYAAAKEQALEKPSVKEQIKDAAKAPKAEKPAPDKEKAAKKPEPGR